MLSLSLAERSEGLQEVLAVAQAESKSTPPSVTSIEVGAIETSLLPSLGAFLYPQRARISESRREARDGSPLHCALHRHANRVGLDLYADAVSDRVQAYGLSKKRAYQVARNLNTENLVRLYEPAIVVFFEAPMDCWLICSFRKPLAPRETARSLLRFP